MREKILELLSVTQFYENASEQIESLLGDIEENDLEKISEQIATVFDITELEDAIIPLYEERFNEDELDQILSFFNSEVGVKMLQLNQEISDPMNEAFATWLSEKYEIFISQSEKQK